MRALLMACLAGLVSSCLFSTARAMDFPPMTVPESMGVQLKGYCEDTENLDKIRELGLKFVRRGFIWSSVEKKKGEYDFSEYDKLVKDCEERGLLILGCIALGNKIYPHVRTPEGREAYAKYAAKLAERYKGKKIIWELWNEPNICTFWGKHGKHNSPQYAQEYYELVKLTTPMMKKADPECKVMAGSVSGIWSASQNWMINIFKLGVLSTGIDAWSMHPYTPKCPEGYIEGYAWARKMMIKQGKIEKPLPIINSERGFPLGKAEGFAGGDASKAKDYQAWHVVRQYLIDQYLDIRMTDWYEWIGHGGFSGFSLYSSSEELPAYKACKVMIEQLKGYDLDKRIELDNELDFVLRYVNKAGAVKLVAWTSPVERGTPDKIVDHEAQIPVEATGALKIVDIYGVQSTTNVNGGKVTLNLSGAPQYITLKP